MLELDKIYHGDSVNIMADIDDSTIDMTVTSPPYDDLREYKGYSFDFPAVAKELFRVTKDGGVVAWNVCDATLNYQESLTSFKQAIYFVEEIGFGLLDTMVYERIGGPIPYPSTMRYAPRFEYVFILTKGKPSTFNPIKDVRNTYAGVVSKSTTQRQPDGSTRKTTISRIPEFRIRSNVWRYQVGFNHVTKDKAAYEHPAIMHEKLAGDLIRSWSNPGEIILDPMCGSGTTCKMAKLNDRRFIGIDCAREYVDIARKRVAFKMLPI